MCGHESFCLPGFSAEHGGRGSTHNKTRGSFRSFTVLVLYPPTVVLHRYYTGCPARIAHPPPPTASSPDGRCSSTQASILPPGAALPPWHAAAKTNDKQHARRCPTPGGGRMGRGRALLLRRRPGTSDATTALLAARWAPSSQKLRPPGMKRANHRPHATRPAPPADPRHGPAWAPPSSRMHSCGRLDVLADIEVRRGARRAARGSTRGRRGGARPHHGRAVGHAEIVACWPAPTSTSTRRYDPNWRPSSAAAVNAGTP